MSLFDKNALLNAMNNTTVGTYPSWGTQIVDPNYMTQAVMPRNYEYFLDTLKQRADAERRYYEDQVKTLNELHKAHEAKRSEELSDFYVTISNAIVAYTTGDLEKIKECLPELQKAHEILHKLIKIRIDNKIDPYESQKKSTKVPF
jgi:hypothetical protein